MILVTGASGHIGNVLVRELLAGRRCVRVLLRSDPLPPALAGLDVEPARGDILDPDSLTRAMQGVDIVYHLAARISLATGPDPQTGRVNLDGTCNVIEAARQAGVRRLVYASSIYALRMPPDGVTIDETQPFDPAACRGAYDRSKARASLAVLHAVEHGMDALIVCPTAVTGPYDFHNSEAGRSLRLYMRPGPMFYVQGAYDFIDVRDVAHGLILAAEHGRRGQTYILGGDRLTVHEVARAVWDTVGGWHVGLEIPPWLAYAIAGLMPLYARLSGAQPLFTRYSLDAIRSNSFISHARAVRELGFQPRPARQALVDAVRWFQQERLNEISVPDTIRNAVV